MNIFVFLFGPKFDIRVTLNIPLINWWLQNIHDFGHLWEVVQPYKPSWQKMWTWTLPKSCCDFCTLENNNYRPLDVLLKTTGCVDTDPWTFFLSFTKNCPKCHLCYSMESCYMLKFSWSLADCNRILHYNLLTYWHRTITKL